MFIFKDINKTSTVIQQNIVNYTQNLNTSSVGINSIKVNSGSNNNNYWQSLNNLFYSSGSPIYNENKYGKPTHTLSSTNSTQYLTKYHGYPTSSLITIPSTYYGEKIKKGSFKFIDLNNPDNDGNNPIIVDDGNGNLYSKNANSNFGTLAASDSSISSSDNYVGNVFYDKGLAVITETGSWSGSVNYSNLGTNYTLKFDSYNTINTMEYGVTLDPNEFNHSMNYTLRSNLSSSNEPLTLSTHYLSSNFTSSDFQPYITTINLYHSSSYTEPVIQATLPNPIRKSNKISTTFKIKLDI